MHFVSGRRAAGLAFGYEHRIAINEVLLQENPEPMLRDTVAHEFAHVVVWWSTSASARIRAGMVKAPSGHGIEWQDTCVKCSRSNRPAAIRSTRATPVHAASAAGRTVAVAGSHLLTTSKHRRAMAGTRYACAECNSALACEPEPALA